MKRIIKINASSLPWMTCSLKWYRHVIEGWKEPRMSAAIVYGIAFHKFMDTMYKSGGDMPAAIMEGSKSFGMPKVEDRRSKHLNDLKHWTGTCFQYWNDTLKNPPAFDILQMPDGKPATEVTFEIPYHEDETYQVLLCGTIDRLVKVKNGCFAIRDFKTTSDGNPETYLESYSMSHQLRFYTLSLKLMAELQPESMLGKIGATRLGAFIDGIFIRPSFGDNEHHSSRVFMFSDEQLNDYRSMLNTQIKKLLNLLDTGMLPPKEGLLNGMCGGRFRCGFFNVCSSDNEQIEQTLLKRDFIQKTYDPLHHND